MSRPPPRRHFPLARAMTDPADDGRANAGDAGPAEEPEAAPGDWLLAAAPPPQKSKKRKVLAHESVYLDALPSASMY